MMQDEGHTKDEVASNNIRIFLLGARTGPRVDPSKIAIYLGLACEC